MWSPAQSNERLLYGYEGGLVLTLEEPYTGGMMVRQTHVEGQGEKPF